MKKGKGKYLVAYLEILPIPIYWRYFGKLCLDLSYCLLSFRFLGSMNDDFKILSSSDTADDGSSYSATGMSSSVIAARVSYVYNLLGPCLALDTACSSALIAIHLGSQAIKSGKLKI